MVFGFAVAVIAGFLFTAVGNWTGRETATGAPLLALAALGRRVRRPRVFARLGGRARTSPRRRAEPAELRDARDLGGALRRKLTLLDTLVPESLGAAVAASLAGCLAAARAIHWGARYSYRQPVLWILHAGYAWIAAGLLLRGIARFAGIAESLGTHALTVGAIGSLTLGMMARVGLGHAGRPLVVSKVIAWAFGAVSAAAVIRVVVPLFVPAFYFPALVAAGVLWTVAFAAYFVAYAPILWRPRLDGEPG
jgi:uncharacterized protein involved in response to NO